MKIPQANPGAFVRAHRGEIDSAIARVLDSGCYLRGSEVRAFERDFATLLDGTHVIGVASGTEALWLALKACGLEQGDEVITVAFTAVATVAAIVEAGGRPVFVDVGPDDLTMDPVALHALADLVARAARNLCLRGPGGDCGDRRLRASAWGQLCRSPSRDVGRIRRV